MEVLQSLILRGGGVSSKGSVHTQKSQDLAGTWIVLWDLTRASQSHPDPLLTGSYIYVPCLKRASSTNKLSDIKHTGRAFISSSIIWNTMLSGWVISYIHWPAQFICSVAPAQSPVGIENLQCCPETLSLETLPFNNFSSTACVAEVSLSHSHLLCCPHI